MHTLSCELISGMASFTQMQLLEQWAICRRGVPSLVPGFRFSGDNIHCYHVAEVPAMHCSNAVEDSSSGVRTVVSLQEPIPIFNQM